jgi:hypothetical protein
MASTAAAEYDGTSGPLNTSAVRVLAPVEAQRLDPGGANADVRSLGRFVVIRARWNFLVPIIIPEVSNNHLVFASMTEVFPNPASGLIDLPGIGAAHMFVRSVAPQVGKVFVNGYIDYDRDLNIRISLFIF